MGDSAAPEMRGRRRGGFLFCSRFVYWGIVVQARRFIGLGHGDLQTLKRRFQLFDLAIDLFGILPRRVLLQLGNAHLQGMSRRIMGPQRG
ncbi:hypothetical protein [Meridianimarinicoccus sp. MJW13]|uniref:hypothetical protein n=1 Tax=Meridianimarinicoccus sp. MJW13 TaxID=2720031 RepID=UPI0018671E4E|nr:hypothetical protein [Fluviibacterium sp. MJW13]